MQPTESIYKECVLIHKIHTQIRQVILLDIGICTGVLDFDLACLLRCIIEVCWANFSNRLIGVSKTSLQVYLVDQWFVQKGA